MGNKLFKSAFQSPADEFSGQGKRPVVFDILGPDRETSILPEGLRLVLHVNPKSMKFSYNKVVEVIQTLGGYVEQHWGSGANSISFDAATGGFMRLFSGLSNVTGGRTAVDLGGTRRETIAYDKYLDLLALFHNNARLYDNNGAIVTQGVIQISFDGHLFRGWFDDFNVSETAENPYQFELSANFTIDFEKHLLRSTISAANQLQQTDFIQPSDPTTVQQATPTSIEGFDSNQQATLQEPAQPLGPSNQGFE